MPHFGPGISRRLWTIWHHQVQNYQGQPSHREAWSKVEEKKSPRNINVGSSHVVQRHLDRSIASWWSCGCRDTCFQSIALCIDKSTDRIMKCPASPKEVCLPSSLKADKLVKYNTWYYSTVNWQATGHIFWRETNLSATSEKQLVTGNHKLSFSKLCLKLSSKTWPCNFRLRGVLARLSRTQWIFCPVLCPKPRTAICRNSRCQNHGKVTLP